MLTPRTRRAKRPPRVVLLVHCRNSKYWFRRVGDHPIFESVRSAPPELARDDAHESAAFLVRQGRWEPFAFIDLCEAVSRGRSSCELLCRRVQQREWELLFDHCWRVGIGEVAS